MKIENVKRFGAYAAAFIVATSGIALSTREARAEGVNDTKPAVVSLIDDATRKAKEGTIIDEPIEIDGVLYYRYKVKENDTASRISTRIVSFYNNKKHEVPEEDLEMFREDPNTTCRFWPAVVYCNLNKKGNFRIHPGDIIKFPASYAGLKNLNAGIKANGWFANFLQTHQIYKSQKTIYIDKEEARRMVGEAVRYMYPDENIPITDELVAAYLKLHGYSGKYVYKEGATLNRDQTWEFYEWLPTKEDLYGQMEKTNKKSK